MCPGVGTKSSERLRLYDPGSDKVSKYIHITNCYKSVLLKVWLLKSRCQGCARKPHQISIESDTPVYLIVPVMWQNQKGKVTIDGAALTGFTVVRVGEPTAESQRVSVGKLLPKY